MIVIFLLGGLCKVVFLVYIAGILINLRAVLAAINLIKLICS